VDVKLHAFLTSALAGYKWSASRPGCIAVRERAPFINWMVDWVGPRACPDDVAKKRDPRHCRESKPRSSSLVVILIEISRIWAESCVRMEFQTVACTPKPLCHGC